MQYFCEEWLHVVLVHGGGRGGVGWGAAETLYGKYVVPVGNVIQGKASSLDKIFTVTNWGWRGVEGGLGQSLAVSLELWKISEYEWEKMCGLVEYQDKLRNQAKIHLLPDGSSGPLQSGCSGEKNNILGKKRLIFANEIYAYLLL